MKWHWLFPLLLFSLLAFAGCEHDVPEKSIPVWQQEQLVIAAR